jgi:ATP-binding cassette subfamily C protein LapB
MTQVSTNENSKKSSQKKLAKVATVALENDVNDDEMPLQDGDLAAENIIIQAVRLLLREFTVRKSGAAIRDSIEIPHTKIGPREAVSALTNLGFKASFGSLKIKTLSKEFFPLIALKKNGEAVLALSPPYDDKITLLDPTSQRKFEIALSEFNTIYSGYFIIVKQLNKREKEEQSGHWFFSAFRKSKWIYVQVMIAAMVSNFLSLTTALFTMTVYDRVIPNGAFESLIALSIGVIIALGFDFLIKSLRARFIDTASKRADLEISRRLFERILTLTPNEQRQKNWCDGRHNT